MPSRSRLPRTERRAQLVAAAAAAFVARGFDGTSMDDVAQEAGVSRLIVYRNFESKTVLYRAVLDSVLLDLADAFAAVDLDEVRARGAAHLVLPVARRHPDAFRLLWRHAWHEPDFADQALFFRRQVTYYAHEMLAPYVADEVILGWAGPSAGAHLVDGICRWLDVGDASRDDDFADMMTRGLRSLAAAWAPGLDGRSLS
jgi:AcrR family transcriptional regulator